MLSGLSEPQLGSCQDAPACAHICLPRVNASRECVCSLGYTKEGDTGCTISKNNHDFRWFSVKPLWIVEWVLLKRLFVRVSLNRTLIRELMQSLPMVHSYMFQDKCEATLCWLAMLDKERFINFLSRQIQPIMYSSFFVSLLCCQIPFICRLKSSNRLFLKYMTSKREIMESQITVTSYDKTGVTCWLLTLNT